MEKIGRFHCPDRGLLEFRENFSRWDVLGILEYFSSFFFFFWISRFEIGQFFPLQPRLWIISEGDFAVDEFLNFPSL